MKEKIQTQAKGLRRAIGAQQANCHFGRMDGRTDGRTGECIMNRQIKVKLVKKKDMPSFSDSLKICLTFLEILFNAARRGGKSV